VTSRSLAERWTRLSQSRCQRNPRVVAQSGRALDAAVVGLLRPVLALWGCSSSSSSSSRCNDAAKPRSPCVVDCSRRHPGTVVAPTVTDDTVKRRFHPTQRNGRVLAFWPALRQLHSLRTFLARVGWKWKPRFRPWLRGKTFQKCFAYVLWLIFCSRSNSTDFARPPVLTSNPKLKRHRKAKITVNLFEARMMMMVMMLNE